MKKFVLLIALFLICPKVSAIILQDVKMPLPVEYRLGTSDEIEKKYEIIDTDFVSTEVLLQKEKEAVKNVTYADLTLNNISKDMIADLKVEQKYVLEDLKTLWIGAASKSESVKFAIYKLSNPDEDKPSNNVIKKVIRPLASVTSLAGLGVGDPFVGTAALMSGTLLNNLSITDNDLNYKYSKVNDADMVVLVRKIDDLQKNLTETYYDYMKKREYLNDLNGIVVKRENLTEQHSDSQKEILQILDTYYKEAVEERNQARTDFLYVRSTLEQLVGEDSLAQFEKSLTERSNY
ncbi:hypothetical protein IJS77_01730 [bacterium]|nr:hypothetical protein [bacterium]